MQAVPELLPPTASFNGTAGERGAAAYLPIDESFWKIKSYCPLCSGHTKSDGLSVWCTAPPCEWNEKRLELFEKSLGPHKFSSTQFNLDDAGYSRGQGSPIPALKILQDQIVEEDLAGDGKEPEFHITLKYGLHTQNPEEVKQIVHQWVQEKGQLTVYAELMGVSIFPASEASAQRGGEQYDVVKVDVESEDLVSLNKVISNSLSCTDTHPDYQPHITLAYVKPGLGQKYVGEGLKGHSVLLHKLIFSNPEGNRTEIDLHSLHTNKALSYLSETTGGALVPSASQKKSKSLLLDPEGLKRLRGKYKVYRARQYDTEAIDLVRSGGRQARQSGYSSPVEFYEREWDRDWNRVSRDEQRAFLEGWNNEPKKHIPLLRNGLAIKSLKHPHRSYFSECKRDEEGRCLPKGSAEKPKMGSKPENRKPVGEFKGKKILAGSFAMSKAKTHEEAVRVAPLLRQVGLAWKRAIKNTDPKAKVEVHTLADHFGRTDLLPEAKARLESLTSSWVGISGKTSKGEHFGLWISLYPEADGNVLKMDDSSLPDSWTGKGIFSAGISVLMQPKYNLSGKLSVHHSTNDPAWQGIADKFGLNWKEWQEGPQEEIKDNDLAKFKESLRLPPLRRSSKSLEHPKKGTCKPGQRADLTGCIPATGEAEQEASELASEDSNRLVSDQNAQLKPKKSPERAAQQLDGWLRAGVGLGVEVYVSAPEAKYRSPINYVMDKGKAYLGSPLPEGIPLGTPRECFRNASMLMMEHKDWDYVEGFAMPDGLLPVLHAWCVTPEGKVVDNTFRDPEVSAYYGVKYDRDVYMKHLLRTRMFGVLGNKDKNVTKVLEDGGLPAKHPKMSRTKPGKTGTKSLKHPTRESYFATCERDDEGRCLPSGQSGVPKPQEHTKLASPSGQMVSRASSQGP